MVGGPGGLGLYRFREQIVDFNDRGPQPFRGPPHIISDPHPWAQEVNVLTRSTEQHHKLKDKGHLSPAITTNDAGLVAPENFADDTVVKMIPRLPPVLAQSVLPFHNIYAKSISCSAFPDGTMGNTPSL